MSNATETLKAQAETDLASRRLHDRIEWFNRQWAPSDPRENAEFQADFMVVVHEIYFNASQPMYKALSDAYARMPIQSIILK